MGEVFWLVWEVRTSEECGYRTLFVSEMRFVVMPYTSAEIPPAGAPSGFDYAAMIGFIA